MSKPQSARYSWLVRHSNDNCGYDYDDYDYFNKEDGPPAQSNICHRPELLSQRCEQPRDKRSVATALDVVPSLLPRVPQQQE